MKPINILRGDQGNVPGARERSERHVRRRWARGAQVNSARVRFLAERAHTAGSAIVRNARGCGRPSACVHDETACCTSVACERHERLDLSLELFRRV